VTQRALHNANVLLGLNGMLDKHFINTMEQKLEKTHIRPVDSHTVEKLIDKDEKVDSVLSDEEKEQVKGVFEKAIDNKNMTVTVESMSTDELPVVITMSEFMRRMKDMAKLGGGGYGFMGEMP